jgi:hypothetical protein
MCDTEVVPRRPDRPDGDPPLVDEQLADELLARAQTQGAELLGQDGLLSQVTKAVLERALDRGGLSGHRWPIQQLGAVAVGRRRCDRLPHLLAEVSIRLSSAMSAAISASSMSFRSGELNRASSPDALHSACKLTQRCSAMYASCRSPTAFVDPHRCIRAKRIPADVVDGGSNSGSSLVMSRMVRERSMARNSRMAMAST